jgi:aspartate ammonia-lyase
VFLLIVVSGTLFVHLLKGEIMRTEKDSLGRELLPEDAVYGIHTLRSSLNFPFSGEYINAGLIKAYLYVKKAAAVTNYNCGVLDKIKYNYVIEAIDVLIDEADLAEKEEFFSIYDKIIVDPYQGGAGTSLNMNINEVIANTSLKLMGKQQGEYDIINPIDDINLSQSTNDTFITALKVASIKSIRQLSSAYAKLQGEFQRKETELISIIKLGRTQYQDAVPITLGQEFGAYAQAVSRDRWRLYNGEERLRSVNLGGTAVGNSVSADREYVLNVTSELNKLTGLPLAKAEDFIDSTQNLDVFVEVHGLIKSGAVSLIKICNDLRFISSGPHGGIGEILLPELQAGSSIMPGKVNPVILENTIQVCELVKGHDVVISNLVSSGNLELNAFSPLIAHLFLKSADLLKKVIINLSEKCIAGIKADEKKCKEHLMKSSAIAASLINHLGYDRVTEAVKRSEMEKKFFTQILIEQNLLSEEEVFQIVSKELGINKENVNQS